jgi:hypothetical protein
MVTRALSFHRTNSKLDYNKKIQYIEALTT